MAADHFIGLLSGTSRDGIDAVLVRFDGDKPVVVEGLTRPYPPNLREALHRLPSNHPPSPKLRARLDEVLADRFAATVKSLLRQAHMSPGDIKAIGSHGQTVWHDPDGDPPSTVQVGDGALIAKMTGITTVSDFRTADIKAGGQGAPLAPLLHRHLFAENGQLRSVLNIGGIANITVLGATGGVSGFDTGPGNCLMDAWARRHLGQPFDNKGQWASGGKVIPTLLSNMLADPYFARKPPKSTGVEYFSMDWLDRFTQPSWAREDVQATLCMLTIESVIRAISAHTPGKPERLMVCGGGAHNEYLLRTMRAYLPGVLLETTDTWGINADLVEGVLFAWLARERLLDREQDTTAITGASGPVLLGVVNPP